MKGNFIYKRLGNQIEECRHLAGLSQEDLSVVCEIDRAFLGRIERGRANPTFKTFVKISKGLHIPLRDLFEGV